MKSSSAIFLRLHWLNLPGVLLIAFLQRTPVLRTLVAGSEQVAASPAGQMMRSVFSIATLGSVHSLVGATTFIVKQGTTEIIKVSTEEGSIPFRSPATGTAGANVTPIAFTYTGTPSLPQYFRVSGQLPPGLSFIPAAVSGTVPSGTPVIAGMPTVAGNFTVQVQGFGLAGNGQPEPINFTITGPGGTLPPSITLQPASQTVTAGAPVTFTAGASGAPAPAFQWRRNGTDLAGATGASLTISVVQPSDAGDYTMVASNSTGSKTSSVAKLTVTASEGVSRLSNLSVRTTMLAEQTLIVGVVVNGGTRNILVRAAGPALAAFGLSAAMTDPRLDLYNGSTLAFSNDDWAASLAPTFASVGAFAFPDGSKDAGFVQSIDGARSIQAQGTGPGVVLVEAYDTGAGNTPRMVNVSARNRVGTGDDILIAGFNIAGTGSKQLLVRAIGPGLAAFEVPGTLVDPKLEIYTGSGVKVAESDNWTADLAPTFSAVGAFVLPAASRDAALLTTLVPGSYTVQVRGADGGTGEALIEIYEVP